MLPQLNVKADNMTMINQFLGYNHNLVIQDTEFYEMENMSNDYFPVMSNRMKRGIVGQKTNVQAMLGGEFLSYVDDNKLYYDESKVVDLEESNKERQLVKMGAYIVVFPDGVIYNTYDGKTTYIQNKVTTTQNPTFTLCKLDGTAYDSSNTVVGSSEPDDKTKFWLDTSTTPVVLKVYGTSFHAWVSVATTYVKVSAPGIGKGFKKDDAATFEGVDKSDAIYNNFDFNQSNIIRDCGDDYLIVVGLINKVFTNSKPITVERKLPELDFVCELNNRIWGCSSINHEIYACKQGDPTNWYCYAGLDSDSYAATIGTDNIFTGCVAYNGTVLFFKEHGIHKVYGTKPSNYEIGWLPGKGLQNGSAKSIVVVNDYLMYKARDSFIMYDGSITPISTQLGAKNYYEAVGGVYRNKYYVSTRDDNYNYSLFCYDTSRGTWCREDDLMVKYMAYASSGLYMCDMNNKLMVVNVEGLYTSIFPISEIEEEELYPVSDDDSEEMYPGDTLGGTEEEDFTWSLTTGEIGLNSPYEKYIKKINLRFQLDTNAKLKIELMYDSEEEWKMIQEIWCTRKRSYSMPIPVKRCDHFKIRLSGFGNIKLYSIAKSEEEGSAN